jgi:hypothetical protein
MFSEGYELNFNIINSCMLHIKRNRKYILKEVFHDIHVVYEGLPMDAGARNSGTVHKYFCRQTYWK